MKTLRVHTTRHETNITKNDSGAPGVPDITKEDCKILAQECVETLKKSLVQRETKPKYSRKDGTTPPSLAYWTLPIGSMSTVWDLFEHRDSLSVLKDILSKALGERIKTAQTSQKDSARIDNLSLIEKRAAAEKWVEALGLSTQSAAQQQKEELASLKASVIALKEAQKAHKEALEALTADPGNQEAIQAEKASDAMVLAATAALMAQSE